MNRLAKWMLIMGFAGPTLFAASCSAELRDAIFGAGVSYIGALASDLLTTYLP